MNHEHIEEFALSQTQATGMKGCQDEQIEQKSLGTP